MSKPGSLTVNGKTFGPTVPEVQKAEIVVAKPSKKIPKIVPEIINNPSVEESLEVETVMIPVDPKTGGRMWYNRIKATKSFQDQPGKPGIPIHLLGEPQVTILAEQYSFKNQDDKAICSFRYSVFSTQVEAAIYAIEGPSKSRGGRNFYSTIQEHEPRRFLFDYDYEDPSLDSDDKLDEVEPVKLEEIINSIISSFKTCCGLVISRKDLFIFICSRIGKISFHIETRNHYSENFNANLVVAENSHKSSPNLDIVVYKKQQLWRLWKSSKVGKTNYKFLENSEQVPNNRILPQQIDGCIKVDLLEEFKAKPMNSTGFEEADVPEQVQESLEGKIPGCSIDGSRVHFNGSPCPIHKSVHERENGYVFCMEKTWFFKCHRQIRGEKSVFLWKEPEDPIPEELIVKDCFNFKDEYFYNDLFTEFHKQHFTSYDEAVGAISEKAKRCLAIIMRDSAGIIVKNDNETYPRFKPMNSLFSTKGRYVTYDETVENKKGGTGIKIMKVNIYELFVEFKSYNYYTNVPYAPGTTPGTPKGKFNILPGFCSKLLPEGEIENSEAVRVFEDLVNSVVADGNEVYLKFILDWFSMIVRHPEEKSRILVILYSLRQQIGKNTITDFVSKYIFGQMLSTEADGLDCLTDRFNSLMSGKHLIILNEAPTNKNNFHEKWDKIKSRITSTMNRIEGKGIDTVELRDFSNYMITTNNRYSVKVEADNARIAAFTCSDRHRGDTDYFDNIHKVLFNQEGGDHVYSWLFYRNGRVNFNDIPETDLITEGKEASKPSTQRFIEEIGRSDYLSSDPSFEISEHVKGEYVIIPTEVLYLEFCGWCKSNGMKLTDISNKIFFSRAISGLVTDTRRTDEGTTTRTHCKKFKYTICD